MNFALIWSDVDLNRAGRTAAKSTRERVKLGEVWIKPSRLKLPGKSDDGYKNLVNLTLGKYNVKTPVSHLISLSLQQLSSNPDLCSVHLSRHLFYLVEPTVTLQSCC